MNIPAFLKFEKLLINKVTHYLYYLRNSKFFPSIIIAITANMQFSCQTTMGNNFSLQAPFTIERFLLFSAIGIIFLLILQNKSLKRENKKLINGLCEDPDTPDTSIEEDICLIQKEKAGKRNQQLHHTIQSLVQKDKIHLRSGLTQSALADLMKTNVHYLSGLFANYYNTNYNDFINELRVKEACKIIQEDRENKLSIEQVAEQVGISSRSTFYNAFKKFTGVTPSYYQKNKPGKEVYDYGIG